MVRRTEPRWRTDRVLERAIHCRYHLDAVGDLRFVWDPGKSATNARKHGVTFTEAETVFLDEEALLLRARDDAAGGHGATPKPDRTVPCADSGAAEAARTS